jgi:hypothetical protein
VYVPALFDKLYRSTISIISLQSSGVYLCSDFEGECKRYGSASFLKLRNVSRADFHKAVCIEMSTLSSPSRSRKDIGVEKDY